MLPVSAPSLHATVMVCSLATCRAVEYHLPSRASLTSSCPPIKTVRPASFVSVGQRKPLATVRERSMEAPVNFEASRSATTGPLLLSVAAIVQEPEVVGL